MLDDPRASAENGQATDRPVRSHAGARRPPIARTRTATLLVVALGAALLGAAALTGLLFAVGAIHGSAKPTTVVQSVAASGPAGTASSLNAKALYKASAAGVVDITARGADSSGAQGDPFAPPDQTPSTASGTGSVIDAQGRILTASHVVDGASSVTVRLQDGTTRTAKVLGEDRSTDVALLKIDPAGLTLHPLPLGSSTALAVGDPLAVIGDPLQYDRSLTIGVVSGLDRTIQAPSGFSVAHAIQTDASLNPGNSGGPVLDGRGRVVGIADQIATGGSGSSGLGFAVPIDVVKSELSQLERGAQVSHAYLGASTTEASDQQGAVVQGVRRGSPAAAAGLRSGDAVTAIDGAPIHGSNDLIAAVTSHKPGDRVTLTVQRGSGRQTLHATLAAQPRQP
jgi:S1-C subfamily serine protease